MVTTLIKQEWPTDAEIPSFRAHQSDENVQLNDFVKRLTEAKESAKYTYTECAFGALAIREMVMGHMRERRKRKDLDILKGQAALTESSNGDTERVESESSSSGSSPPSYKK